MEYFNSSNVFQELNSLNTFIPTCVVTYHSILIAGHGLEARNGIVVRRLNQHQIHVSLGMRLQTIPERVDEGLKIFETTSYEDHLFQNEDELINHIIAVLKNNNVNRLAKEIVYGRGQGQTVFHGTIF